MWQSFSMKPLVHFILTTFRSPRLEWQSLYSNVHLTQGPNDAILDFSIGLGVEVFIYFGSNKGIMTSWGTFFYFCDGQKGVRAFGWNEDKWFVNAFWSFDQLHKKSKGMVSVIVN